MRFSIYWIGLHFAGLELVLCIIYFFKRFVILNIVIASSCSMDFQLLNHLLYLRCDRGERS